MNAASRFTIGDLAAMRERVGEMIGRWPLEHLASDYDLLVIEAAAAKAIGRSTMSLRRVERDAVHAMAVGLIADRRRCERCGDVDVAWEYDRGFRLCAGCATWVRSLDAR